MKKISRRSVVQSMGLVPFALKFSPVPSQFDNWFAPMSRSLPGGRWYQWPKVDELLVMTWDEVDKQIDYAERGMSGRPENTLQKFRAVRDYIAEEYADGRPIHMSCDVAACMAAIDAIKYDVDADDMFTFQPLFVGLFLNKNPVYIVPGKEPHV